MSRNVGWQAGCAEGITGVLYTFLVTLLKVWNSKIFLKHFLEEFRIKGASVYVGETFLERPWLALEVGMGDGQSASPGRPFCSLVATELCRRHGHLI